MKKKNKGFTLIELLAVIVILAIIIIIVSVNVLSILNTSKEQSFKLYAERLVTKCQEVVLEKNIDNIYEPGALYFLEDFGFKRTGKYTGCVIIDNDNTPRLYLTDNYYSYQNTSFEDIQKNHVNKIVKTTEGVEAVKQICTK